MSLRAPDFITPRILIVDDERQIHASMRLRLGRDYDLVFTFGGQEAIERIRREQFDLCFADIHMPRMDGLTFIESARAHDAELGFVVVSAFDTAENLKRAIPLQVLEFISKPLPDKAGFERRVPEWIAETRRRRHERGLASHAGAIGAGTRRGPHRARHRTHRIRVGPRRPAARRQPPDHDPRAPDCSDRLSPRTRATGHHPQPVAALPRGSPQNDRGRRGDHGELLRLGLRQPADRPGVSPRPDCCTRSISPSGPAAPTAPTAAWIWSGRTTPIRSTRFPASRSC
jgi:CheY-like chemotaxis protein